MGWERQSVVGWETRSPRGLTDQQWHCSGSCHCVKYSALCATVYEVRSTISAYSSVTCTYILYSAISLAQPDRFLPSICTYWRHRPGYAKLSSRDCKVFGQHVRTYVRTYLHKTLPIVCVLCHVYCVLCVYVGACVACLK